MTDGGSSGSVDPDAGGSTGDERCPSSFGEPEEHWTPIEGDEVVLTFAIPEGFERVSGEDQAGTWYEVRFNQSFVMAGQERSVSIVTEQHYEPAAPAFMDMLLGSDDVTGPVDFDGQSLMVARRVNAQTITYILFPEIDGEPRQVTIGVRWASTGGACTALGEELSDKMVTTLQPAP